MYEEVGGEKEAKELEIGEKNQYVLRPMLGVRSRRLMKVRKTLLVGR